MLTFVAESPATLPLFHITGVLAAIWQLANVVERRKAIFVQRIAAIHRVLKSNLSKALCSEGWKMRALDDDLEDYDVKEDQPYQQILQNSKLRISNVHILWCTEFKNIIPVRHCRCVCTST